MAEFVMLIGLPASGKSSLAENYAQKGYVHISSDSLREEMFGDVNDQDHNAEVFEEMKKRTFDCLRNDKNVVYDACNISSKKRANFIKQLPDSTVKTAIFVATPVEHCMQQNSQRERKVPIEVIWSMYKYFTPPMFFEGWTQIKRYETTLGTISQRVLYRSNLMEKNNVPHDNPFHKDTTCLEHCAKVFAAMVSYCNKNQITEPDHTVLLQAAYYHDCAKYKARTYVYKKCDGYAHYPQHANMSAYDYLCFSCEENNVIFDTAALICFHMDLYNENQKKTIERKLGYRLYNLLLILNKMDRENP